MRAGESFAESNEKEKIQEQLEKTLVTPNNKLPAAGSKRADIRKPQGTIKNHSETPSNLEPHSIKRL